MLLSIYSHYKILAIFPVLYNTSFSLSYTQEFIPFSLPPHIAPCPSPMVMTSVFSMSVSLLFAIFTSLLYFLNPTYK